MEQIKQYEILKDNFDTKLYEWMKKYYIDVCSNGDVQINWLLDQMNAKIDIPVDSLNLIDHIYTTYKEEYNYTTNL